MEPPFWLKLLVRGFHTAALAFATLALMGLTWFQVNCGDESAYSVCFAEAAALHHVVGAHHDKTWAPKVYPIASG